MRAVGYEVTIGTRTFAALPPPGETVTLAIDACAGGRDQALRLRLGT